MILFLSNGAGEDAIAARIAVHLQQLAPQRQLAAFPLVGEGVAYPTTLPRHGVMPTSPSGGLSNESWRLLLRDLRSGLIGRLGRQYLELRRLRRRVRQVVAVGDLMTVLWAGLAGHRSIYFVGTAKSSYHHPYSWLEAAALRCWARYTFARDLPTAQDLGRQGVNAGWVGNAMMDGLEPLGLDLGVGSGEPCLALFPGSRAATYQELPRLLAIYRRLPPGPPAPRALVALASSIDLSSLAAACLGWTFTGRSGTGPGLVGTLEAPGCLPVGLVRGALGDVLACAQVALGQAGTAHEQSAGLGVPVVSVHPPGQPLGWYRGRQKGLLGEALWVVSMEEAPAALSTLFADRRERDRRAAVGRERMGPDGGARRMAEWIAKRDAEPRSHE